MSLLDWIFFLAAFQLAIAAIAVTVDLLIVFRIVWLGIIKEVPTGDWKFIGRALRTFAETEREKQRILEGRR